MHHNTNLRVVCASGKVTEAIQPQLKKILFLCTAAVERYLRCQQTQLTIILAIGKVSTSLEKAYIFSLELAKEHVSGNEVAHGHFSWVWCNYIHNHMNFDII